MKNKRLFSNAVPNKRIFFKFLLFILLLFTIVPTLVKHTAADTNSELTYQINNDCVTITGYTGNEVNIAIPDTIEGYPVTVIGKNAFMNSACKSITLPSALKKIGAYAFYHCNSLININIPDGVTTIEAYAFSRSNYIKDINIPDTVSFIGYQAFLYTTWYHNLKNDYVIAGDRVLVKYNGKYNDVIIPDGIKVISDGVFENASMTSATIPNSVTYIGYNAFYKCTQLKSLIIPNSVKYIGIAAFKSTPWFDNLPKGLQIAGDNILFSYTGTESSITIPQGVISIAPETFSYSSAKNITLPESVVTIGADAFKSAHIESIIIPDSVTQIGEGAFSDCIYLTTVTLSTNISQISRNLFNNCTSLSSVNIPDSVTIIEDNAFSYCIKIKSIILPENTTYIGNSVFEGCYFDNIILPDRVEYLGRSAFKNSKLNYIKLPKDLSMISDNTFEGCYLLETVILPENLSVLGKSAFINCVSLVSISLPDSITVLQDSTFYGCYKLQMIQMPAKLLSIGNNSFYQCFALTNITFPNGLNGIGKNAFYSCIQLTNIKIPNSTEYINDSAFNQCTTLRTVALPDGLSKLGNSVFAGCISLNSITIPDSVIDVGSYLFQNAGLKSVMIPKSWTSIPDGMLKGCDNITEVIIPDNITVIGAEAFTNTRLQSFIIPDSIMSIGKEAFKNCFLLSSISISSKVKSIGIDAFVNTPWFENNTDTFHIVGDGILIQIDLFKLSGNTLIIPNGVKKINDNIFGNTIREYPDKATFTSIVIPEGVTYIGVNAFKNCSNLKSLKFPSTLITLDNDAFSYCISLECIIIPRGVETIGDRAFKNCFTLDNVIIPDTVIKIGNEAFADCYSLNKIIIPESVVSFGMVSFSSMYGNITIYGVEGSAIQSYAGKWLLRFDVITLPTPMPAATVVTFDYGITKSLLTVFSNTEVAAPLYNPDYTGYLFDGWYTESSGGSKVSFPYTVTGDVTLYAHWISFKDLIPSKVNVDATNYNTCQISWSTLNGATEYRVYRATNPASGYKLVAKVQATEYSDTNLNTGTKYYYKIQACLINYSYTSNDIITNSKFSIVKNAVPLLKAPTSVKISKAKNSAANISWSDVSGANGYVVYRATNKNRNYSAIADVSTNTYTNSNLKKGVMYYYKVISYRVVGGKKVYSGYSTLVSIKS